MQVISSKIISNNLGKVRAIVVVEVKLDEATRPIQRKCVVEVSVSPSAPERRINRKVSAQAKLDVTRYFDGEDTECSNIFSNAFDTSESGELSALDEQELQAQLRQIEEEFSLAT